MPSAQITVDAWIWDGTEADARALIATLASQGREYADACISHLLDRAPDEALVLHLGATTMSTHVVYPIVEGEVRQWPLKKIDPESLASAVVAAAAPPMVMQHSRVPRPEESGAVMDSVPDTWATVAEADPSTFAAAAAADELFG